MPRRRKVTRLDHQTGQTALIDSVRSVNAFDSTPVNLTADQPGDDANTRTSNQGSDLGSDAPSTPTPLKPQEHPMRTPVTAKSWRRRGINAPQRRTTTERLTAARLYQPKTVPPKVASDVADQVIERVLRLPDRGPGADTVDLKHLYLFAAWYVATGQTFNVATSLTEPNIAAFITFRGGAATSQATARSSLRRVRRGTLQDPSHGKPKRQPGYTPAQAQQFKDAAAAETGPRGREQRVMVALYLGAGCQPDEGPRLTGHDVCTRGDVTYLTIPDHNGEFRYVVIDDPDYASWLREAQAFARTATFASTDPDRPTRQKARGRTSNYDPANQMRGDWLLSPQYLARNNIVSTTKVAFGRDNAIWRQFTVRKARTTWLIERLQAAGWPHIAHMAGLAPGTGTASDLLVHMYPDGNPTVEDLAATLRHQTISPRPVPAVNTPPTPIRTADNPQTTAQTTRTAS